MTRLQGGVSSTAQPGLLLTLLIENRRLKARLSKACESARQERARAEQKADEFATMKKELDAFSYSVSHDLRAPLRTVDGFATMLQEDYGERLDDEGRRLLGVLRDGSRRMSGLIDDLLKLSRLARQPVNARSIDLGSLVQEVIGELRAEPEAKGRAIDFVVGDLGSVTADRALLKQTLASLIGNAIKFTRHKERAVIEIGRRVAREGEGAGYVYFVRDNGAGFDMRYAGKLFGVFQRLHSANEYEGTGIGLAMVQRAIARHGGRAWGEAVLGEGATFNFVLWQDPSM